MTSSIRKSSPRHLSPGSVLIEGVTKRFRKFSRRKSDYTTVKSSFIGRILGSACGTGHELVALKDFHLEILPGAAVGIIGRNGSGKSTLLKLIAGIYRPDTGRVVVSGKVAALIELGAGFHPEFTGRENVYLGGAMYGMSRREIDERFDSIVRFAELEDCIDDPVRTYSSGMYMRLGFSVAICCDPDILLIDEVLAVGDAAFVHRCFDTISDFKRRGKTLILVTHDLDSVSRWCDEAIWLDKGWIRRRGEPQWVIDSYLSEVLAEEESELEAINAAAQGDAREGGREPVVAKKPRDSEIGDGSEPLEGSSPEHQRWGNRYVEITHVEMIGRGGESRWIFSDDEALEVVVRYRMTRPVEDLVFGVGILRMDGLVVHGTNTQIDRVTVPLPRLAVARSCNPDVSDGDGKGDSGAPPDPSVRRGEPLEDWEPVVGEYRYRIHRLGLVEGTYFLDVAAHRSDGTPFDYHHRLYKFSVRGAHKAHGIYTPEHSWIFSGFDGYSLSVERVKDCTGRGGEKGTHDILPFAGVGFKDDVVEDTRW